MQVRLEFQPRDLWVGVFLRVDKLFAVDVTTGLDMLVRKTLHVYICLVPMLPIHVLVGCKPIADS